MADTTDRIAVDVTLIDSTGPGAASAKRNISSLQDTGSTTASSVSSSLKSIGSNMKSVGTALTIGVTVPLVAVGVASMKMASQFQADMTLIQTQAGASASQVAEFSKQILAMSAAGSEFTPDQLANGLYHIISVGVPASQAMAALAATQKLAAIGQSDLETTTSTVAVAMKSGIAGANTFGQTVNTLNAIVGAGNMRMGDLIQALGPNGILGVSKSVGLSLQDTGAALAYMSDATGDPIASATHLRMAFTLMASGSAAANKSLQTIGLSTSQLGLDLQKGGLMGALGDLKSHLDDVFGPTTLTSAETYLNTLNTKGQAAANALGVASVNAFDVVSKAFGGAKTGASMIQLLEGFSSGALGQKETQIGDTSAAGNADYAATQQTTAYKMKAAWASVNSAMVSLGNTLNTQVIPIVVPFLAKVANWLEGIANWFDKLNNKQKDQVLAWAGIAIAAGPVLVIVGTLAGALGNIIALVDTLKIFQGVMLLWRGAMALTGIALNGLGVDVAGVRAAVLTLDAAVLAPVALVIATAGALGALALVYQKVQEIQQAISGAQQSQNNLTAQNLQILHAAAQTTDPTKKAELLKIANMGGNYTDQPIASGLGATILSAFGINYAGSYASGGVIPGASGAPSLAIVHGGETVVPAGQSAHTNNSIDIQNINLYTAAAAQEFFRQINQDTINIGKGLTTNQGVS